MEDESFLLGELGAPVRSFRLYALEKFIQDGASETLLNALLAHKESEDDPECLVMLEHAIGAVRSRLEGGQGASSALTYENFLGEFAKLDDSGKISALNRLPLKLSKMLSPLAPDLLQTEPHQMVKAILLRTFGRFWPKDRLKEIAPLLRSDHLSTRIAVLETLILQAPDLLSRDFPKLLTSKDPRLRALAVRGLAKVDEEEALAHLEVLFDSRDPSNVLAALQNSVFFPFDRVKPMLLKTIALESNEKLVERFGLFLENNPSPDIPYRLWEIAESATGEKEKAVKAILQKCCRNIEQTGVLEGDYKDYYNQLQMWIMKRARVRWAQDVLNRLSDPGVNRAELEGTVREKLKSPQMKAVLTEALAWPQAEPLKGILLKWLEPGPSVQSHEQQPEPRAHPREAGAVEPALPGAPASPPPKAAPVPFAQLTAEEKIRLTASWQKKDLVMVQAYLASIFHAADTPHDLLATGLRTALRLEVNSFGETARKNMKSKDGNLASAALEYLAKFDADFLLPHLGTFLQSDQLRIKSTALKILQRTDPKQSLSVLGTMLSSKNPEQQKVALACMVHFEFSLLRTMLFRFLQGIKDDTLAESGLFIFKANPEAENLYLLYCLEKHWEEGNNLEWAKKAKESRAENEKILTETSQLEKKPTAEREKTFEDRRTEEKAKAAKPPPSYSVKNLAMDEQINELSGLMATLKVKYSGMSTLDIIKALWAMVLDTGTRHPAIVGVLALCIGAFWALLGFEAGEAPMPEAKGTSVFAAPHTITGTILQCTREGLVMEGKDGKTYALSPLDGKWFQAFPPQTRVKATIIPFRVSEEGVVRGQCKLLENP